MTSVAIAKPGVPLPSVKTIVAIGAVLLGTFTSILNSRLTEIGLADIRGALGLGFDEASWITTAYVVAEVTAIPAAVWLRGILSPTRGVQAVVRAEFLRLGRSGMSAEIIRRSAYDIGHGAELPLEQTALKETVVIEVPAAD